MMKQIIVMTADFQSTRDSINLPVEYYIASELDRSYLVSNCIEL